MALRPASIAQSPYLHPVGNTPAVCLTDSLAPEIDAKVLLLGCGDVRNILFTVYSGRSSDKRMLDFTCCDIDAEIIARNIIILTLIVEEKDGAQSQHLWNIYYHIFLSTSSMEVLQTHVKSLLNHSQSLQNWNAGPYSSLIRFCDKGTFQAVVKLWERYATDLSSQEEYKTMQNLLKDQWKAAQDHQKVKVPGGSMYSTVSAAAPILSPSYDNAEELYRTFWATGLCKTYKNNPNKFTIYNPLFECRRSGAVLHYDQNPLSGFHLALAYTQLTAGSPLALNPAKKPQPTSPTAFMVACGQFAAWAAAFRKRRDHVTIRFVNADAVAFSNVLQHQRTHNCSEDAHWYRNPWTFESLAFDNNEYSQPDSAPTIFNVIDTSNLFDHLGGLNVLTAVSPLLEHTPYSTLRTEMIVPRYVDVATSAERSLCGDLPAVGSLLGLKPIQYWTNASMTLDVNESVMPNAVGSQKSSPISRRVILWKRLTTSSITYDDSELAQFLHGVYLKMFADESWGSLIPRLSRPDRDLYTRAGLASLLRCIKGSNILNWNSFILNFMDSITKNSELNMAPHHFQSLCAHLEMFSLLPMNQMPSEWGTHVSAAELSGPLRGWNDIPSVICITLVVPRKAVALFSDKDDNDAIQCQLQLRSSTSEEESYYPDIQMCFGTVDTTGEAFSDQYRITVAPDAKGWKGDSPLIVSAMVATSFLTRHRDTAADVVFALRNTVTNVARFRSELGRLPDLHASKVGGEDVFVTKYRPNTGGHMSIGSLTPPPSILDVFAAVTIRPKLTAKHVTSVQVRYDITSEAVRRILQGDTQVTVKQPGLFQLRFNIGSTLQQTIDVPFPLNVSSAKINVDREQSRIDYTAPVADIPFLAARPDNIFPLDMHSPAPLLEHLAYVVPETLPMLHLDTADWLEWHTTYPVTMSASEYKQYENIGADSKLTMPGRLSIKDNLHSFFMYTCGLRDYAKSKCFHLDLPASMVCTILVDSVRMDLSHQTVFLDAALLTPQASGGCDYLKPFIRSLRGHSMRCLVDEDEAVFWRHLLPAFAERCRSWDHKSTCEYRLEGRLPISTEDGKPFVCSCGSGDFPDEYLADIKAFETVKKFAVRVAIPVIFASSLSKDGVGPVDLSTTSADAHRSPSAARTQATQSQKKGCLECGAATTKDGNPLLKCSKCMTAQYCSKECQRKDRKKHKQTCEQVQEKDVGNEAA